MTAGPEEERLAAKAMALGEAERVGHIDTLEAMHVTGSAVDVADAARNPNDIAVAWTGESSQPPAVSPQPTSSPNTISERVRRVLGDMRPLP